MLVWHTLQWVGQRRNSFDEDETTWVKDLYKLQKRKASLMTYLVFQLMEYTKGRTYNSAHEIKNNEY